MEQQEPFRVSEPSEMVVVRDLCQCSACRSVLVQEVDGNRHAADKDRWTTLLECPECDNSELVYCSDIEIQNFDLDQSIATIFMQFKEYIYDRMNQREEMPAMRAQSEMFIQALRAGHILPEDF